MSELLIVQFAREALQAAMYVASPALIVSMAVGLSISIFQVVTSLQDPTVSFVPKVLIVMLVIVLSFPWMVRIISQFTIHMFSDWNSIIRQFS